MTVTRAAAPPILEREPPVHRRTRELEFDEPRDHVLARDDAHEALLNAIDHGQVADAVEIEEVVHASEGRGMHHDQRAGVQEGRQVH